MLKFANKDRYAGILAWSESTFSSYSSKKAGVSGGNSLTTQQKAVLEAFDNNNRVIVKGFRRFGLTTLSLLKICHDIAFSSVDVVYVSNTHSLTFAVNYP